MTPERSCPDCGAALPLDAPRGLCPNCLMAAALSQPAADLTVSFEPRDPSLRRASGALVDLAETLGGIPHLLLHDTEGASGVDPLVQPASPEMPVLAARSARLQLFGEIARGGMGAVLKGRDVDLGRDLAVKVLLEKHRDRPELVRRFVEEAQIAGQLQHPGVVPIYELGAFADRRPYFAMKLVKGRTLAGVLADRGDVAEGQMGLLGTLLQVGQTVAFAHARGVIHRDLKPSNVMVGSFGEVQVMDWGLAKVLPRGGVADDAEAGRTEQHETLIATARSGSGSDQSQAGSVLGTPAYMAPEQARGEIEAVDRRADVFALGAMLCEVLTGQPAFTGRSAAETLRKAGLGDLSDARSRLDSTGADAELIALARDCLARERDDRPRDASAFVDRLAGYLASIEQRLRAAELERAAQAARAEEAQARIAVEQSRRRRTVALAASLLAILTLGSLSGTYVFRQRQAAQAAADRILGEATILLGQARARSEDLAGWQAASAAVKQIDATALPPEARTQLDALASDILAGATGAKVDRDLLADLVDIRSAEADDPEGSATDAAYADAFRTAKLDVDLSGPDAAGNLIRSRATPVALELAAALDDWASNRRKARPNDAAAWARLVATARVADPDPRRDELRALWEQPDGKAQLEPLRALAAQADVDRWPAPTLNLLGAALHHAGDGDTAIALLRRAAGRHADDVWINFNLATLLEIAHPPRRDEAIRFYTAARAVRPETAHELAHNLEARGQTDEAIDIFMDLKRLRPQSGWHLGCLGAALQARGRSDEARAALDAAVAALRETVRLKPEDPQARLSLGNALRAAGQEGAALAEYRAALRLNPDNTAARSNLGVALMQQGQTDAAFAEFRAAVRLRPDAAPARVNLGSALATHGHLEEAVSELREAIRLDPDNANAHGALGSALAAQGQQGDAIAEMRESLRLKPDSAESHSNLGDALRCQGQADAAIAELREAIRLKPDLAEAHNNLGLAFSAQGQHAAALAEFREAIRLKPVNPVAHNSLGTELSDQGQADAAIAEFRAAIRLNPDYFPAHYNLGNALWRAKRQRDAAVAEFHTTIEKNPQYAEAHCNLGFVLREQGKYAESLAEMRIGHALGSKQSAWSHPSATWVRQAEHLAAIADRLPAILSGDAQPKDTADRFALAQMCYDTKHHAAAARLWAQALGSDQPALADNLHAGQRYNAACAAALAGCGHAQDVPPPDAATRAELRRQALDWLRADLALRTKQLDSDSATVRKSLRHWKSDPDLAGIRDPAAIAALPEPERNDWKSLWAQVDRLLVLADKER